MDDNRKKALSAALGQIEKQFGKGAVMRLGDSAASRNIETISTGSINLDIAWVSVVCQRGGWLKSTARNLQVKPPWPFM